MPGLEELLFPVLVELVKELGLALIHSIFGKGEKKKRSREALRHAVTHLRDTRKPASHAEKENSVKLQSVILAGLLVLAAGCSSLSPQKVCDTEKTVTDTVTNLFVTSFECQAPSVVEADVFEFVDSKVHACQPTNGPKGIGSTVCRLLVDKGVEQWGSQPLPSTWKCKATAAKATVTLLLEKACDLVPFKPKPKVGKHPKSFREFVAEKKHEDVVH